MYLYGGQSNADSRAESPDGSVRGRIFDIQRYSVHDGPGIRTIVFFKGCALRCRWCCNPESQESGIQTMIRAGKAETVGRDVTVDEVLSEVLRDRPYYLRSGGGMTLSGGEALLQPEFAHALLRAAHDEGLDTAIETAGFVPEGNLARVLPEVDHVLMDIKHMDGEKHRAFTGQSNERILSNAHYAASHAKELIIRVPVIPTFNDTEEEIRAIAAFAAGLPGVKKLHLLPYHRLGQDKYTGLSRDYGMGEVPPPTKELMEALLSVAEESGLTCQIGG